jgi:hypothetical protein
MFRNKQDEYGVVKRNKARVIAKGYSQVEGLDFDEIFTPVGRLESICMLLAYATHHATFMGTNGHLNLDLGSILADQNAYHSIIGSLLYLCVSRSDIMLSVCMCARFQAIFKDCYLRTVKRIMRYLVFTPNLGLWYPKGSRFELLRYSDVDYVECKIDRKSTSRSCQFLCRSLVSWSLKK